MKVSIHAPARGATRTQAAEDVHPVYVSIHAPARGATFMRASSSSCIWSFNPRAREGRDKSLGKRFLLMVRFQSTRPRGARPTSQSRLSGHDLFQSTRPRGARPSAFKPSAFAVGVSIHAPARGATTQTYRRVDGSQGFNPRAREGRDVLMA